MSRMRGAPVIALAVIVLAAAISSVGAAAPLDEAAAIGPRTPSVKLASGVVGADSWSASLRRESGVSADNPAAKDLPCIEARSAGFSGGNVTVSCAFGQPLTPSADPLWVTSSEPNEADGGTAMTAVAMVFAPVTASLKATRLDGTLETIRLKRLTAEQARKAGLKRLRYAAFATTGRWCVTQLESFDRAGHRLWESSDARKRSCATED
jgi:hypothetical protein